MGAKFHAGRVIENRRWTDTLFSLRVEGPRPRFEAGQFVRIGIEPTLVRAFSFVNPPEDLVLEFYGVVVP
jgi:ferredoxin-NADP reductase